MTVYFVNDGLMDLDVIRLMGVSVKIGDNPIGYFGTGLKFSIATLLRTSHKITLQLGSTVYDFGIREKLIRGKWFNVVTMAGKELGFTTELGKNWEVWQAYRELHSNCLDEGGTITAMKQAGDTVITVDGSGIEEAFKARAEIFVHTRPIAKNDNLEIHPGESRYIYYRGVRAGAIPGAKTSMYTYNILQDMELTEDRTLAKLWSVEYCIESNIPSFDDKSIHDNLLSGSSHWDQCLNFSYAGAVSKEFLDSAEQVCSNVNVNEHARRMVIQRRQEIITFPAVELKADEQGILKAALGFIRSALDAGLRDDQVTVTETLGPGVYGLYRKKENHVFITRQAIDNGPTFVASTLYEEWIHMKHGLKDCSRELQQFLFDRVITLAGRLEE